MEVGKGGEVGPGGVGLAPGVVVGVGVVPPPKQDPQVLSQ